MNALSKLLLAGSCWLHQPGITGGITQHLAIDSAWVKDPARDAASGT
jgi:hypothetical protein